ncbi:putative signal transducing protein [Micromonospora sp. NPDC003776]
MEIVDGATVLTVVGSRIEAELIVGMLQSHGLRAVVVADDAGGMRPHLQMKGVRVLVHPSDEASARQLLAAVDDPAGPTGVDPAAAGQRSTATDRIERDLNDPQQDL